MTNGLALLVHLSEQAHWSVSQKLNHVSLV